MRRRRTQRTGNENRNSGRKRKRKNSEELAHIKEIDIPFRDGLHYCPLCKHRNKNKSNFRSHFHSKHKEYEPVFSFGDRRKKQKCFSSLSDGRKGKNLKKLGNH